MSETYEQNLYPKDTILLWKPTGERSKILEPVFLSNDPSSFLHIGQVLYRACPLFMGNIRFACHLINIHPNFYKDHNSLINLYFEI